MDETTTVAAGRDDIHPAAPTLNALHATSAARTAAINAMISTGLPRSSTTTGLRDDIDAPRDACETLQATGSMHLSTSEPLSDGLPPLTTPLPPLTNAPSTGDNARCLANTGEISISTEQDALTRTVEALRDAHHALRDDVEVLTEPV